MKPPYVSWFLTVEQMKTSGDEHRRIWDSSFTRLPTMSGSYTTSAPEGGEQEVDD